MLQAGGAWSGVHAREMLDHVARLHAHPLDTGMLGGAAGPRRLRSYAVPPALRRAAAAARAGAGAGRPPGAGLRRRADRGHGPAGAPRRLGAARGAARRRRDGGADHPLHGRGRTARRPGPHPRPRQPDRVRHAAGAHPRRPRLDDPAGRDPAVPRGRAGVAGPAAGPGHPGDPARRGEPDGRRPGRLDHARDRLGVVRGQRRAARVADPRPAHPRGRLPPADRRELQREPRRRRQPGTFAPRPGAAPLLAHGPRPGLDGGAAAAAQRRAAAAGAGDPADRAGRRRDGARGRSAWTSATPPSTCWRPACWPWR